MKLATESKALYLNAASPGEHQPPCRAAFFPHALLTSLIHFPLSVGFE